MKHPEIKTFDKCPRPALVRMNIAGRASFAFVGVEGNAYLPAFVLMANSQWRAHNLSSDWGILSEFEDATVIDFGNKFEVRPDYSAFCQISKGELFQTPGAIIKAGDKVLLAAAYSAQGAHDKVHYMELKSGRPSGEPGGAKVAFSSWSLFVLPDDEQPLFTITLPETSAGKPNA